MLVEASRLFREGGLVGTGVEALTEAVGMTRGVLYSQFGSKDALIAEVLLHGHALIAERSDGKSLSKSQAISRYLSPQHRDNPGSGCFMAALGADMPRQSRGVRKAFTQIVIEKMGRLSALVLERTAKKAREDDALHLMSTLVGAIILSRAVDDPRLSDRILSVSRSRLKN